jgi:hypothetical protein
MITDLELMYGTVYEQWLLTRGEIPDSDHSNADLCHMWFILTTAFDDEFYLYPDRPCDLPLISCLYLVPPMMIHIFEFQEVTRVPDDRIQPLRMYGGINMIRIFLRGEGFYLNTMVWERRTSCGK